MATIDYDTAGAYKVIYCVKSIDDIGTVSVQKKQNNIKECPRILKLERELYCTYPFNVKNNEYQQMFKYAAN